MMGVIGYTLGVVILILSFRTRKRFCPSPLLNPVTLLGSLLFSLYWGLQFVEGIGGFVELLKIHDRRALSYIVLLLAVLVDAHNWWWVASFSIVFIIIRWYCIVKDRDSLLFFMVLSALFLPAGALYALLKIITRRVTINVKIVIVSVIIIGLIMQFLEWNVLAIPAAIVLGTYEGTYIKGKKEIYTRFIFE